MSYSINDLLYIDTDTSIATFNVNLDLQSTIRFNGETGVTLQGKIITSRLTNNEQVYTIDNFINSNQIVLDVIDTSFEGGDPIFLINLYNTSNITEYVYLSATRYIPVGPTHNIIYKINLNNITGIQTFTPYSSSFYKNKDYIHYDSSDYFAGYSYVAPTSIAPENTIELTQYNTSIGITVQKPTAYFTKWTNGEAIYSYHLRDSQNGTTLSSYGGSILTINNKDILCGLYNNPSGTTQFITIVGSVLFANTTSFPATGGDTNLFIMSHTNGTLGQLRYIRLQTNAVISTLPKLCKFYNNHYLCYFLSQTNNIPLQMYKYSSLLTSYNFDLVNNAPISIPGTAVGSTYQYTILHFNENEGYEWSIRILLTNINASIEDAIHVVYHPNTELTEASFTVAIINNQLTDIIIYNANDSITNILKVKNILLNFTTAGIFAWSVKLEQLSSTTNAKSLIHGYTSNEFFVTPIYDDSQTTSVKLYSSDNTIFNTENLTTSQRLASIQLYTTNGYIANINNYYYNQPISSGAVYPRYIISKSGSNDLYPVFVNQQINSNIELTYKDAFQTISTINLNANTIRVNNLNNVNDVSTNHRQLIIGDNLNIVKFATDQFEMSGNTIIQNGLTVGGETSLSSNLQLDLGSKVGIGTVPRSELDVVGGSLMSGNVGIGTDLARSKLTIQSVNIDPLNIQTVKLIAYPVDAQLEGTNAYSEDALSTIPSLDLVDYQEVPPPPNALYGTFRGYNGSYTYTASSLFPAGVFIVDNIFDKTYVNNWVSGGPADPSNQTQILNSGKYTLATGNASANAAITNVSGTNYQGEWVQLRLLPSLRMKLGTYTLYPPSRVIYYFEQSVGTPLRWILAGSLNGSTWTLIDDRTSSDQTLPTSYTINSATAYEYYRVIVTKMTPNKIYLGMLQFVTTFNLALNSFYNQFKYNNANSYRIKANSIYHYYYNDYLSYLPIYLLNGSAENIWSVNGYWKSGQTYVSTVASITPAVVEIDLNTTNIVINNYTLTGVALNSYPTHWDLEYHNGNNWQLLNRQSNIIPTSIVNTYNILNNSVSSSNYRFSFSNVNSVTPNQIELNRIRFNQQENINSIIINTTGGVGIGTSTDGVNLFIVNGKSKFFDDVTYTSSTKIKGIVSLESYANDTVFGTGGNPNKRGIEWYYDPNDRYGMVQDNTSNLALYTSGANTTSSITFNTAQSTNNIDNFYFKELARLDQTGNLGIGTTNPIQTLQVIGNTDITGTGYVHKEKYGSISNPYTSNAIKQPITMNYEQIQASDKEGNANYGFSIDISADGYTIVIGAPNIIVNGFQSGATYIYQWMNYKWQETKLTRYDGSAQDDKFGVCTRVNADGTVVCIGAYGQNSVYIHRYIGNWVTNRTKITATDNSGWFGFELSISYDGNRILIGSATNNGGRGCATLYDYNGSSWVYVQKFVASDATANALFGRSTSMSADGLTLLIGAPRTENDRFTIDGKAYIYEYYNMTWNETILTGTEASGLNGAFGFSTALSADGSTAIVGSYYRKKANVFRKVNNVWTSIVRYDAPTAIYGGAEVGDYGWNVALTGDGNTAYVGSLSGNYVFIYTPVASTGSKLSILNNPTSTLADKYGENIAVVPNGDTLVITATGFDQNASPSGAGAFYYYSCNHQFNIDASSSIRNIYLNDGISANPAIAFNTDISTGIYHPSRSVLAFATNAKERLRVDSSGNVGIGTTNPNYKLTVAGDINYTGILYQNGTPFSGGGGGGSNQWTTNGTSIFYNTGNVGLGITSPRQKLDVIGNTIVSGNVGVGTTNTNYKLTVAGDINYTGTLYQNGTPFSGGGGGSSQWTTNAFDIYYTIGNVGIGTTLPRNNLDVIGSTSVSNNIYIGNVGIGTTTALAQLNINAYTGTTTKSVYISRNASASHATQPFMIDSYGNVGIGLTTPAAALHVDGVVVGGGKITAIFQAGKATDKVVQIKGLSSVQTGNLLEIYRDRSSSTPNIVIDGTGANLGIGTTNPSYKLSVVGDINYTGTLYQNGTPFSGGGGGSSQWTTNGTSIYYTTGNVGIGTTNPISPLHVVGDSSFTGQLLPTSCNVYDLGSSNLRWRDLYLSGNTIDLGGTLISRNQEDGGLRVFASGGGTQLVNMTLNKLVSSNITVNGNIGIGTTNPNYKLSVIGDINYTGTLYQNGTPFSSVNSSNIIQTITTGANIYYSGDLYKSNRLQTTLSSTTRKSTIIGWGLNDTEQITIPVTASNCISITAGANYTLALKSDGSIIAWGDNTYGQVSPISNEASNCIGIAAGDSHSLALKSDGSVVAWGLNDYGQVSPIPNTASNCIAVAAGSFHSLALKSDGSIIAWGDNTYGQVSPIPNEASNCIAIVAGESHSLALKSDGSIIGWGYNDDGQVTIPESASNCIAIAAGLFHSLALKNDGSIIGWGLNNYGEIIIPNIASNCIAIAGGRFYSLALKSDGTVIGWGDNYYGETTIPVTVNNCIAIAAGNNHSLALSINDKSYINGSFGIGIANPRQPLDVIGNAIVGGNIGIGTNNPNYKLSVIGDINYTGTLYQNGTPFSGGGGGGSSQWTTNGTSIYYTTGNVGIGITIPKERLDIDGTIQTSNLRILGRLTFGPNDELNNDMQVTPIRKIFYTEQQSQSEFTLIKAGLYGGTASNVQVFVGQNLLSYYNSNINDYNLSVYHSLSNTTYTISLTEPVQYASIVDITIWPTLLPNSSQPGSIKQTIVQNILWTENNGEIYYNTGNVGIGITNPISPLHVVGDSSFTGQLLPTSCNVYDLGSSNLRWRDLYLSGNTIDLGGTLISRNQEDGGLRVLASGSATQLVNMTLNNLVSSNITVNGNIGIGTTNPNYKLSVTGDINYTGTLYQNGTPFSGGGGTSSQWTTSGSNIYYTTGNVGIGTINPITALDVVGNASFKGNLLPNSSNMYDLGSDNLGWKNIYLSGTSTSSNIQSTIITKDITTGGIQIIPYGYSNTYAKYVSTQSNIILPSSIGTINGVNITALNKRTRTSYASAINCVSTWTGYQIAATNVWKSVCWAPELSLFCAVSITGNNNRVMTSYDGTLWTSRTSASDNVWNSLCWASEISLFCAVASTGSGNRVMTSSNGIDWTSQTSAADDDWKSVCWAPELSLFCAVADSGSGSRVMTSSNGITWNTPSAPIASWRSICWASEIGRFCAVGGASSLGKAMISTDGINWTSNNAISGQFGNYWSSVCWSPELSLFCAVGSVGFKPDIMTSPDGINWTARTSPANNNYWESVCWAPEISLFCAVASSYSPAEASTKRIMTSPDGINWTSRIHTMDRSMYSVCWAPELSIFCIVSFGGGSFANGAILSAIGMPNAKNVVKALPSQISINSQGSVGIGTSIPNYKLQVNGYTSITGYTQFSNPGDTLPPLLVKGNGYGIVNFVDSSSVSALSITGNRSIIIGGNVGIGTNNPQSRLHVDGNILATGTLTASNVSVIGDFVTLNTVTSNTEQVVVTNAGTGPALKVTQTGAQPIAEFYDDNNSLALTIADGGNVGIGTNNPQAKLDVNGILNASIYAISYKQMYHFFVSSVGVGFATDQERGVWMNGNNVASSGRSWHLLVVSGSGASKGTIIKNTTYDVYGNNALATTYVNDLVTYNVSNNIIVIHTYDEPDGGGDPIRTALQDSYSAKFAYAPKSSRYAYCYAYRHGFGTLGEAHSAYYSAATLTAAGTNTNRSRCAMQFTVFI